MDFANQVVTVETGAVWHAVDTELNKQGWELAVPGSGGMFVCTVGGSVAYNSVPHGIAEYGMTGDCVIGLRGGLARWQRHLYRLGRQSGRRRPSDGTLRQRP